MATIDTVTDDRGDSATPGGADIATGHDLPPVGAGERSAERLSAGAERRSLLVPVLSTAVGALIAGVLGLAVLGFNTLRDDIRGLDGDIDLLRGEMIQGFARVDERFAQVDQRFAQIDERFAESTSASIRSTQSCLITLSGSPASRPVWAAASRASPTERETEPAAHHSGISCEMSPGRRRGCH